MKKLFKDLGIYIVVFTSIAGSIWLIRDFQENSLDSALRIMGEKLAAMISDSGDQDLLKAAFEQFIQRISNNEVSPEQVEKVAANILNLSNKEVILSREQAEMILSYPEAPETVFAENNLIAMLPGGVVVAESLVTAISFKVTDERDLNSNNKSPGPAAHPEDWEKIGERLAIIIKTNDELQEINKKLPTENQKINFVVQHDGEKGVCIIVADKPATEPTGKELKAKLRRMRDPDGRELVIWERNFTRTMHRQKRRIMHEMKIVQENIARQKPDSIVGHARGKKRWLQLARAKELEAMTFDMNLDSLNMKTAKQLADSLNR